MEAEFSGGQSDQRDCITNHEALLQPTHASCGNPKIDGVLTLTLIKYIMFYVY